MSQGLSLFDSLRNALTGQGTARDNRTHSQYAYVRPMTQHEVAAAYSGSGLMRKIVQIPALDMVREWRDWKLPSDEITAVEAEEDRLGIRQKIREVEIMRALGGGALILGLPGNPEEPAPATVAPGGLAYVHVVSRWHMTYQQIEDDARLPGYGDPVMWWVTTDSGQSQIHPSRVIPFRADTSAAKIMYQTGSADAYWGESVVKQVLDAVKDSDTARASFAALLNKARLTRIGIPRLYEMSASGDDQTVMNRLAILATAESIHNATIFDSGDAEGNGGEKIEDVTYSFAGAKDILNAYAEFVSAVSDIPATRLLGRAPEGMNSSGESQQHDWNKKIRAMQTLDLSPCLYRLDQYLVPSALGKTPERGWFEYAPLDTPSQKEIAETAKIYADAINTIHQTGLVPDEAFARGVQSRLVADGYFPELEQALAEMPEDERFGLLAERGVLEQEGGGDPVLEGVGGQAPSRRADVGDSAPRSLYVSRAVLNRKDLQKWASEQGLGELQPDLHVTVMYSRAAVDWMKAEEDWSSGDNGGLTIAEGGPRLVEPLGNRTAVLLFSNSHLGYRHERLKSIGASFDFPDYQPHVSLTGEQVDLSNITPYTGKIELGPEIFEEVDE